MKKMSAKEFKKVFEDAGYSFDIYGYEGILNMISLSEKYNAHEAENRGFNIVAKKCRERADYIYDVLTERGYYNN